MVDEGSKTAESVERMKLRLSQEEQIALIKADEAVRIAREVQQTERSKTRWQTFAVSLAILAVTAVFLGLGTLIWHNVTQNNHKNERLQSECIQAGGTYGSSDMCIFGKR